MILREAAQRLPEEAGKYQNIDGLRYFNTNNIWVNLKHLKTVPDEKGVFRLPMIVNVKTIDPNDDASPRYTRSKRLWEQLCLFSMELSE